MVIAATARRFSDVVTTEAELRALLGHPSERVTKKELPALDVHCRAFIALAPFMLLGMTDAEGGGDGPGFGQVLDDTTLVIPDRRGHERFDSLRNILAHGGVGLLFMIPGVGETLRVNGHARLIRDADAGDRSGGAGSLPALRQGAEALAPLASGIVAERGCAGLTRRCSSITCRNRASASSRWRRRWRRVTARTCPKRATLPSAPCRIPHGSAPMFQGGAIYFPFHAASQPLYCLGLAG